MNVASHQEKEKNDATKTFKRKAGEERRQATDFKEAARCPSVVFRGQHGEGSFTRGVLGVLETLAKANSHFDPTPTGSVTASPR